MKTQFNLNVVLVMFFSLSMIFLTSFTINDPVYPKSTDSNILILKGDILNHANINISVYFFDESDCAWYIFEEHTSKKNYSLMLNPLTNYQVSYKDEAGRIKKIYIEKGMPGIWQAQVNIDFELKSSKYARLYQVNSEEFSDSHYTLEGIDISRFEEILSEIEDLCH